MGIDDHLLAYWFDEAVELFGTQVDAVLTIKEKKGKKTVNKYSLKQAIKEVLKQYKKTRGRTSSPQAIDDWVNLMSKSQAVVVT